jgi:hypothetical protein
MHMRHYKKIITCTKKSKKGRQEWARACRDASLYFYLPKKIWSLKMPLIYVIQCKNLPCKEKFLTTPKLGLW